MTISTYQPNESTGSSLWDRIGHNSTTQRPTWLGHDMIKEVAYIEKHGSTRDEICIKFADEPTSYPMQMVNLNFSLEQIVKWLNDNDVVIRSVVALGTLGQAEPFLTTCWWEYGGIVSKLSNVSFNRIGSDAHQILSFTQLVSMWKFLAYRNLDGLVAQSGSLGGFIAHSGRWDQTIKYTTNITLASAEDCDTVRCHGETIQSPVIIEM